MSFFSNLFNKAKSFFGNVKDRTSNFFGDIKDKITGKYDHEDQSIPPAVRKFLREHGDEQITSLDVGRQPISSMLDKALDLISFGKFSQGKSDSNVDKFFHLYLIVNNKYRIEKNQLVKCMSYEPSPDEQRVNVTSPSGNIRDFLMTASNAGDKSTFWGKYQAFSNNCQDWVTRCLSSNGLLNPDIASFIKQPIDKLIQTVGSGTIKTANAITDLGATVDNALQNLTGGALALRKGGVVLDHR